MTATTVKYKVSPAPNYKSDVVGKLCEHNHWSLEAAYVCSLRRARQAAKRGEPFYTGVVYADGSMLRFQERWPLKLYDQKYDRQHQVLQLVANKTLKLKQRRK